MNAPKRKRKPHIDRMSASARKEYYKSAVEYYGNLKDQLKGFRAKDILHPLLLLIMHAYPVKVVSLNSIDWSNDSNPVIFSANHNCSCDIPAVSRAVKKHFFILSDYTLINDPVVDLGYRLNGIIYVDRKSKQSTRNAYEQCVAGVKSGYNLLIFPESTWNLTQSLPILPRYWGDVKIAQETGSPIIPTILVYCGKICLIKFGEQIYVSKDDSIAEKDKEVYNAMVTLKKEIQDSPEYKRYHKPMEYADWVRMNIESYKFFDVDYEMSCIRDDGSLPQDELEQIRRIGEEIHPVAGIRQRLKYAMINYRYEENEE